jgi:hypothetical protein
VISKSALQELESCAIVGLLVITHDIALEEWVGVSDMKSTEGGIAYSQGSIRWIPPAESN